MQAIGQLLLLLDRPARPPLSSKRRKPKWLVAGNVARMAGAFKAADKSPSSGSPTKTSIESAMARMEKSVPLYASTHKPHPPFLFFRELIHTLGGKHCSLFISHQAVPAP